jgi:DNA polymerase sigma
MVISFLQRHPKISAGHIKAEDNLGAMLIEILELYGTRFNFDRVGIAIDRGGFYFEKLDYQRINQNIWKKICVRDPNDANNNIAKASHQSDNIVKVFADAFRDLTTRSYLIHAKIKAGETAPWGTECGSILDAIIERPLVVTRRRLERLWNENLEGGIEMNGPIPTQAESSRPNSKGPNRKERRAMEKATKEQARKKRHDNGAKPAIIIPPASSTAKRKTPTAAITTTGTKDAPIILEDASNSPSP